MFDISKTRNNNINQFITEIIRSLDKLTLEELETIPATGMDPRLIDAILSHSSAIAVNKLVEQQNAGTIFHPAIPAGLTKFVELSKKIDLLEAKLFVPGSPLLKNIMVIVEKLLQLDTEGSAQQLVDINLQDILPGLTEKIRKQYLEKLRCIICILAANNLSNYSADQRQTARAVCKTIQAQLDIYQVSTKTVKSEIKLPTLTQQAIAETTTSSAVSASQQSSSTSFFGGLPSFFSKANTTTTTSEAISSNKMVETPHQTISPADSVLIKQAETSKSTMKSSEIEQATQSNDVIHNEPATVLAVSTSSNFKAKKPKKSKKIVEITNNSAHQMGQLTHSTIQDLRAALQKLSSQELLELALPITIILSSHHDKEEVQTISAWPNNHSYVLMNYPITFVTEDLDKATNIKLKEAMNKALAKSQSMSSNTIPTSISQQQETTVKELKSAMQGFKEDGGDISKLTFKAYIDAFNEVIDMLASDLFKLPEVHKFILPSSRVVLKNTELTNPENVAFKNYYHSLLFGIARPLNNTQISNSVNEELFADLFGKTIFDTTSYEKNSSTNEKPVELNVTANTFSSNKNADNGDDIFDEGPVTCGLKLTS